MANTSPEARQRRNDLLREWARLQRDYPQYTNGVNLNFLSDKAIKSKYGQGYSAPAYGDPTTGQIVFNTDQYGEAESRGPLNWILRKELGQAIAPRLLGSSQRGDAYMNAIGYHGDRSNRTAEGLVGAGAGTWGQDAAANAMNYGYTRSYPQDLYGIDFANAIGAPPPFPASPTAPMISAPATERLQRQGILPYPSKDVSQQGADVRQKLVAFRAAQMQQRKQEQNSANAARRGGPRNF